MLAAAGAVAGVEGENAVAIRRFPSLAPYAPEAFPEALTIEEVAASVSPFVVGGL